MPTLNTILQEIKDVPVNRLEELSQFINTLTPKVKQTQSSREKILLFGGALSDMKAKDYTEFVKQTKKQEQISWTGILIYESFDAGHRCTFGIFKEQYKSY